MIEFLSNPPMRWIAVGLTVAMCLALIYLIAKRWFVAAVITGGTTASIAAATYDLFQLGNDNAFTFFSSPVTAFIGLLVNAVLLLSVMVYLATQRLVVPTLSMATLALATALVSMGHGRAVTPAASGLDVSTQCAMILTATMAVITLAEAVRARRYRKARLNAA